MKFVSTRAADPESAPACTASEAIAKGLADDGGLYVPRHLPQMDWSGTGAQTLPDIALRFLAPFFVDDPLADALPEICAEAFNFPIALKPVGDEKLSVLELFHGPTAAFKDFGARFLAACFARLNADAERPLTILVATSGDTGGAVAAAFHKRPGILVDVLFPNGQVSPRQAQQLTCWGDNIRAFCVDGPFDACQDMVKQAFLHPTLNASRRLSSANSINLGRLLPQTAYYVWASLEMRERTGRSASFIVPTGNLGNGLACVWAKATGAPIHEIHFATNDNRSVPEFFAGSPWSPRASVTTLANAMDVGNPSNMERLRWLFPHDDDLRRRCSASFVDDDSIAKQIVQDATTRGEVFCPHTATALHAYDQVLERADADQHHVVVATAHPAKFETVVEPLIGRTLPVPQNLQSLLDLPSHSIALDASLGALLEHYA